MSTDPHRSEAELFAEFEAVAGAETLRRTRELLDRARAYGGRFFPERRTGRPSVSVWLGDQHQDALSCFGIAAQSSELRISVHFAWMVPYVETGALERLANDLRAIPGLTEHLTGLEEPPSFNRRPSLPGASVLSTDQTADLFWAAVTKVPELGKRP